MEYEDAQKIFGISRERAGLEEGILSKFTGWLSDLCTDNMKCLICGEEKGRREVFSCAASENHYICHDCLKKRILSVDASGQGLSGIRCPDKDCNQEYKNSDIREVCDNMIDQTIYLRLVERG